MLLDETSPGFAPPIAKHNAEVVGNPGDGAPVCVAKSVAYGVFAHFFGRAAPDVAEFVPQAQMIPMPETIEASGGPLFFEIEKAARHFAVDAAALEDTTVDH